MKLLKSEQVNICLILFLLRMPRKARLFISIAAQLFFRLCHYEISTSQKGLNLNGTNQLLVYAEDVGLLGENSYRTTSQHEPSQEPH